MTFADGFDVLYEFLQVFIQPQESRKFIFIIDSVGKAIEFEPVRSNVSALSLIVCSHPEFLLKAFVKALNRSTVFRVHAFFISMCIH